MVSGHREAPKDLDRPRGRVSGPRDVTDMCVVTSVTGATFSRGAETGSSGHGIAREIHPPPGDGPGSAWCRRDGHPLDAIGGQWLGEGMVRTPVPGACGCDGRGRRSLAPLSGTGRAYHPSMPIPPVLLRLVERGPIAHVVTINVDNSPQVSLAWIGIEDDELVIGTLPDQVKLRNIRRDPRVAVSMVTGARNAYGLDEYLVVYGRARLTEGGAADLLGRLARVYLGPDVRFPPMPDPPPGWVIRIAVDRIVGVGPEG